MNFLLHLFRLSHASSRMFFPLSLSSNTVSIQQTTSHSVPLTIVMATVHAPGLPIRKCSGACTLVKEAQRSFALWLLTMGKIHGLRFITDLLDFPVFTSQLGQGSCIASGKLHCLTCCHFLVCKLKVMKIVLSLGVSYQGLVDRCKALKTVPGAFEMFCICCNAILHMVHSFPTSKSKDYIRT